MPPKKTDVAPAPAPVPKTQEQLAEEAAKRKRETDRKNREAIISKTQLVCVMTASLCIPAGVLTMQSNNNRDMCDVEVKACIDRCTEMYSRINREFASQMIPEQKCKEKCKDQADFCNNRADALIFAAALLFAGLGVSLCLIYLLQAIMGNNEEDVAMLANKKPRAAYVEPTITEEETIKAKMKKETFVPPPTTEVKCLECDIAVPVSHFWLPDNGCTKGGMESSICSRCRKPVVGLL